jgi:hypothetical protein
VDASDLGFAEYFEDLAADSSHSHDEDAWLLEMMGASVHNLADAKAGSLELYLHIPNIGYKGRDLLLHINTYTSAHLFEKNIQVGRIIFL